MLCRSQHFRSDCTVLSVLCLFLIFLGAISISSNLAYLEMIFELTLASHFWKHIHLTPVEMMKDT